MNIIIFFLQMGIIIGALYGAYRLGKEALITLCSIMSVLANFFVLQQIEFFGWNATSSDAFAIGSLFGLNLLQQNYGRETAKKTVWISFFAMVFFVAVSQIHLSYIPGAADTSRNHFQTLLSSTPRLLLASLGTFVVVQWLDLRMYGFALKRWSTVSWRLRGTGCLLVSQAVDTVLFSTLGLWETLSDIGSIIVVSYAIKCVAILATTAGSYLFPLMVPPPLA